MGQASKVHDDPTWDLEETVRQVEQKFATDLKKTITGETTNDEKLLKTLVWLEIQTPQQVPNEYKEHHKHLSTRFGIVFYDDKKEIPRALQRTVILLPYKRRSAINKMSAAAKPF